MSNHAFLRRFKEWRGITFYIVFYGDRIADSVGTLEMCDFTIKPVTIENTSSLRDGMAEAWGHGSDGPYFPWVENVHFTANEAQAEIDEKVASAVEQRQYAIQRFEKEIAHLSKFSVAPSREVAPEAQAERKE